MRRWADRCEAEFVGEPRPGASPARLLAPGGGVVTHFDRFLLPSIAQVEYRLGGREPPRRHDGDDARRTTSTPACSSAVTFRLPLPGWLVGPFVTPAATHIFRRTRGCWGSRPRTSERFGGERFATTELDVLGPQIWRLLQAGGARRRPGEPGEAPEHEHRVRMRL